MKSRFGFILLAVSLLLGRSVFGTTPLITNGDFNSVGGPGYDWSILPESTDLGAIDFEPGFIQMGDVPGPQTLFVYQQLTIPANILYAQFSFSLNGGSPDPSGDAGLAPLVVDSAGVEILTNLGVIYNNGSFAQSDGPFNVSAYIGQTVDITFEMGISTNVLDSSTFFDISQVSLLGYTTNDIPSNDDFSNSAVLVTTSNITVSATNIVATLEPGEPKIGGNSGGHSVWWNWTAPSDGVVTINTKGSTCKTLLGVYTGGSLSSLTQVASNNGGGPNSQVSFPAIAGTTYQIAVDGANGAIGVVQLNLSFTQTAPTVTIKSPASGAKLTNSTVVVQGSATDKVAVGLVQVQLVNANGTNALQNATGTNTWTATVTNLTPGLNTILAIAYDTSGNASPVVSRAVTYVVVSPFTLHITGNGSVSPNPSGDLLDVGAEYKLTAKPLTGDVFSNWTDSADDVLATTEALTFTMESNLVLYANFVPNPFTPLVGTYEGLFYDSNDTQHASSGFVTVTLASSGSYSAKITLAGLSYSLSGLFSAGGVASNNIVRKGLPSVAVQWQLDLTGAGLTGSFSDGVWTAQLNADRPATSPVAQAGNYTLLIPGDDTNSLAQPGGDSYGTVTVSSTGGITFSGELADGTKVSQKANILPNGQWPFYIGLYSGSGSIFGWLTFSNQADSDITGTVDWFKLPQTSAKYYPGGFTNITDAAGSIYLFTNDVPVLNFSDGEGQAVFSNGNLAAAFTNQITLGAANKITNSSPNALTITLTTKSGLFKGSVVSPDGGKPITINGVVLQKQDFGGGFFLGPSQSGSVFLAPVSP